MPSDTPRPRARVASRDALVGAVLGGRYKVDAFLGAGGMGSVYRGTHLVLGTPVAIKLLLPQYASDANLVQKFVREARAASLLRHPNALVVHDFGVDGDVAYMVMELLEGRPLAHLAGENRPLLPVARVARILAQISDAVAAAHAVGIVHRDLKPANVVVEDRATERDFVTVVDFGLARILPMPDRTSFQGDVTLHRGMIVGTPSYMAPEQCLSQDITPATDVYALGVVLYELLTARVPFAGPFLAVMAAHVNELPPPMARPDGAEPVPAGWHALVADALAKDPAARPANARAFRERLLGVFNAPSPPGAQPAAGREAPYTFAARAPAFDGLVVVVGESHRARDLLDAEGAVTAPAANAAHARASAAAVVVLDLGDDATRVLDALATLKGDAVPAPVIVVTRDTQVEAGRALLAAGADDVVVPPLTGAGLLRRVARLARRRR